MVFPHISNDIKNQIDSIVYEGEKSGKSKEEICREILALAPITKI